MTEREKKQPTSEASAPGVNDRRDGSDAGCDGNDARICGDCGSEMERILCESCEDGYTAPGELYEMDPLWYDEDDSEPCSICRGLGGWWACFGRCYDEDRSRTAAVQPADSAADATGPRPAGLLKTEGETAVAPQERETP